MTNRAKEIWVIFDPMDGPHIFRGKIEAWKMYDQWEKEARDSYSDSFWDMTQPTKYVRAEE